MTPLARSGAALRSRWRRLLVSSGLWTLACFCMIGAYGAAVAVAASLAYEAWGAAPAAASVAVCLLATAALAALCACLLKASWRRAQARQAADSSRAGAPPSAIERVLAGSSGSEVMLLAGVLIAGAAVAIGPRRLMRWGLQAWAITRFAQGVLQGLGERHTSVRPESPVRNGARTAPE